MNTTSEDRRFGRTGFARFHFATNGRAVAKSPHDGAKTLRARDGLLADLDFTGKLDRRRPSAGRSRVAFTAILGNSYFNEDTITRAPLVLAGAEPLPVTPNNADVGSFL